MRDVFVSYRRVDSSNEAGRIFDHLTGRFGEDRLFKDVDSIPLGQDFRDTIARAVGQCKVLLAIIGDDWLEVPTEVGSRRIDDPNDYVHIEIAAALQRKIPVIPVLVENATMPHEPQLPKPLRELAFMNATRVRTDPDFRPDMERLLKQLDDYISIPHMGAPKPTAESPTLRQRVVTNLSAALLACFVIGILFGVGSYFLILEVAGLTTVSKDARIALTDDVMLSRAEHQNLLTAQAPSGSVNTDTPAAPYLHIVGVDIQDLARLKPRDSSELDSETSPMARVIIHVGEDIFSYPKNDVWELVDDTMRSSSFKLNDGPVRIELILTVDGRRIGRLNSNRIVTVGIGTRGAEEVSDNLYGTRATVRYEIRSDP